jgi:hypothetical protein
MNWMLIIVMYTSIGLGTNPVDGQPVTVVGPFTKEGCIAAMEELSRIPRAKMKCIEKK